MPSKILVPFKLAPELKTGLETAIQGFDAVLTIIPEDPEQEKREARILDEIVDTEVFFGGNLTSAHFAAARSLQWIQVPYAGVNRLLEVKEIIESPVTVTNSAGIMAPAIADQVMGYIIAFSRRLVDQFHMQQRKEWGRTNTTEAPTIELAGRTVGIIGYGRIGQEIAKRAKAFGMQIIATKNNLEGKYPEVDRLLPNSELEQLLSQSDYVIMCAPLTPSTEGMLARQQFELMKQKAYFINIARGQLVNEEDLIEVLHHNRIAGAALDVFVKEPLPASSPLWSLENVIITPHSSGNFEGFMPRSVSFFAQNLKRYFKKEPLLNLVDKKRGY